MKQASAPACPHGQRGRLAFAVDDPPGLERQMATPYATTHPRLRDLRLVGRLQADDGRAARPPADAAVCDSAKSAVAVAWPTALPRPVLPSAAPTQASPAMARSARSCRPLPAEKKKAKELESWIATSGLPKLKLADCNYSPPPPLRAKRRSRSAGASRAMRRCTRSSTGDRPESRSIVTRTSPSSPRVYCSG